MLSCQKDQETIHLHYLGHSSVFIDFNHEVSVLCDYGEENAYLDWGWDSPVYSTDVEADILSYSNFRPDHYDPLRVDNFKSLTLSGKIDTSIGDLHIYSIVSSETDTTCKDNYSFLFEYHGMKVLHLGDCQADIVASKDPAYAEVIRHRYPEDCDIVILPLEKIRRYTDHALKFTQILSPRTVLPTHYWSERSKNDYIKLVKEQGLDGKKIRYKKQKNGKYAYRQSESQSLILLNLYPSEIKSR
jgi:L-ascorbate metabolism protein UlaG (beta-lactamase superfamily)